MPWAAARPDTPPPTTTTWGEEGEGGTLPSLPCGRGVPGTVAAAPASDLHAHHDAGRAGHSLLLFPAPGRRLRRIRGIPVQQRRRRQQLRQHGPGPRVGRTRSRTAKDDPATGTAGGSVRQAVDPLSRAIVSTGQLTLHSKDIARARGSVFTLVAGWGGTVADEQTGSDSHGRLSDSTMTLRVPTPRFDVAMDALAKVGSVEQQNRSSEDVTTKVIDNQARVRAAERSIRSIENLLGRATRLSDIIAIESDLARRQADLDSLKQQEAWLSDQTSLSTITLNLSRPMPPVAKKKVEARGFLAGLDSGWSALQGATLVGLTLVGALFPFALLAALVGVPLWLVVRRRRPVVGPPAEA